LAQTKTRLDKDFPKPQEEKKELGSQGLHLIDLNQQLPFTLNITSAISSTLCLENKTAGNLNKKGKRGYCHSHNVV